MKALNHFDSVLRFNFVAPVSARGNTRTVGESTMCARRSLDRRNTRCRRLRRIFVWCGGCVCGRLSDLGCAADWIGATVTPVDDRAYDFDFFAPAPSPNCLSVERAISSPGGEARRLVNSFADPKSSCALRRASLLHYFRISLAVVKQVSPASMPRASVGKGIYNASSFHRAN